jgi:hypothetical protein
MVDFAWMDGISLQRGVRELSVPERRTRARLWLSLLDHFSGLIDARDVPSGRRLRQALNNRSESEAHFQHPRS